MFIILPAHGLGTIWILPTKASENLRFFTPPKILCAAFVVAKFVMDVVAPTT
jgi:hypothetical protein